MATFTIGQAAERSGFTASALRYYERHGLLDPVDRSDAGYRLYDQTSVARLEFISRAKDLGCSLDEIRDLAALWARDDCAPVQARLHELVSAKIADAEARARALSDLTEQLRAAAIRLGTETSNGPCSSICACAADDTAAATPIACTLDERDVPDRLDEWSHLLGFVEAREPIDGGGLRLSLAPGTPLADLLRLVVAEQDCCSFVDFSLTVDRRGVALEVRAPDAAADIVTTLFGPQR